IRGCTFSGDEAVVAGGLYLDHTTAVVTDTRFDGETVLLDAENGFGCSLVVYGGTFTGTDVVFSAGSATNAGGAAYATSSTFDCTRCSVVGNHAETGAGVYLLTSIAHLTGSTFSGN